MSLEEFELQILETINQTPVPVPDIVLVLLSYSIYGFLLFMAFYFFRIKEKEKLLHLLITTIVAFLIATSLKSMIDRPRPFLSYPNEIHNILLGVDSSFPSRHTVIAFLLLAFIPKKWPGIYKTLTIIYLLIIPITQMRIGVHYPTDVLGGAVIGLVIPHIINNKISNQVWNGLKNFYAKVSTRMLPIRV